MHYAIIIGIILLFSILLFAMIHYIGGVGRFRLDRIDRIALDKNGHGFHILGNYTPSISQEFSNNSIQIWHIFIRISDGKKFKTKIIEHSGEIAKRSSGYRDGFYNFDSNIWKAKLYSKSIKILSEITNTSLSIDNANSISVNIDEDDSPISFHAGDVLLQVMKIREASGYQLKCTGAHIWKTLV